MAEAEDVITDGARHATIYVRALWRRHRKSDARQKGVALSDVSRRLDLLITAVFGISYPIRVAQPPALPTFLAKVFKRGDGPRVQCAIPATDGASIWLPAQLLIEDQALACERYRVLALQQAMRAWRGSARFLAESESELQRLIYTVLEAQAADEALVQLLPGMQTSLNAHRDYALRSRPPLREFPAYRQPLEELVRRVLTGGLALDIRASPHTPAELVHIAQRLANALQVHSALHSGGVQSLFKDWWTGELSPPPAQSALALGAADCEDGETRSQSRSARLSRRPKIREPAEDEDDRKQGAWMVQTARPHEQAEDAVGMQRPTDRDETTAAQEFADSLSELPEARLVATPGRPKEVLLTDDAPSARAKRNGQPSTCEESRLTYPEWDCRLGAYRDPGATVRLLSPDAGPQAWVEQTLAEYRSILDVVRRRFEMLRAQRVRLRKQLEGEEIDLEACIDSYADFRAGLPMSQALYQSNRSTTRDMAIVLLIDISGSTDGWISANKRVIDVEREALLLVCIALQGLAEPYSVMAFSGQGPHGVTMRAIKSFEEHYSNDIATRIAALEPEHYTRTGAAIRHAAALLMRQAAKHRLLLLLSDGKPNDIDDYEGRYGIEDMRHAVTEAKLQGIYPFCLTIDRQAADYLPAVFGARQYALLPKPELLPTVLLEWMKRLVVA
jgi:nitric oxide reductase NorD protein